jgi:Pentapeptide repeats (8 copies)
MNQQIIYSMSASEANEIRKSYPLGTRGFEKADLSFADLRGIDLSFANLRGADLKGANLSQSILKGADLQGANLNRANLNGARLQGANLGQTQIAWGSLVGADLSGANLRESSLDAATLTRATLQGTDLSGACLYGADLGETILKGAYYNNKTLFDPDLDIIGAGMQVEAKITADKLLKQLNDLSRLSHQYLGNTLTARYWESSRPDFDWLNQFQVVNRSAAISFSGVLTAPLEILQLQHSQLWINHFLRSCSQIIQDLPTLIEQKRLVFAISLLDSAAN